jgi:hypothetical protein
MAGGLLTNLKGFDQMMNFKQVKAAYFDDDGAGLIYATDKQIEALDKWLDANGYLVTANERLYDLDEEMALRNEVVL